MGYGPDVSEHQGVLDADWFTAFDFVIVRAYNEHDNPDQAFAGDWANAARIPRGVYGWAIPDADNFTYGRMLVAKAPDAELGYWVDVERSSLGLASAHDVEEYLRGIESMGKWGGFYSNIGELHRTPTLDAHPWWMADYGPNDGRYHDPDEQAPRPPADRPWSIHQFTSRGGPGGSGLDLNYAPTLGFDTEEDDLMGMTLEDWNNVGNMIAGRIAGNNEDGTFTTNRQVIDVLLRIEAKLTTPPAAVPVDLDAVATAVATKILDAAAVRLEH